MSVTDELRSLLDEHGIEWWSESYDFGRDNTQWNTDDASFTSIGLTEDGLLAIKVISAMTPEQAIAKTVGRETCHIEVRDNMSETDGMGDVWLECDECHWQMLLEPTTPRFKYCPNCGRKVVE